jgi:hypothetical protein
MNLNPTLVQDAVHALIQGFEELADDPLAIAALGACFRVLEAVAQLSMEVGLGIGDIRSLSDCAFISAAQTVLGEEGASDPDNVAKIAVRTGFNRFTVGKLLKPRSDAERNKPYQHHTARVMRAWLCTAGYSEGQGIPKILPIRGDPPSFYALTKATLGDDLPPKLILQDLHRIGAVKTVPNKQVQLVRTTYGSAAWDQNQIQQVGDEISDHFRALLQLLQQRQPAPFHRYITQAGLGAENAAILARELARGAEVLMEGHRRALQHESRPSSGASGQKQRLSAGLIIFREPDSPRPGPSAKSSSARSKRGRKSTPTSRTNKA